jgi:hypothetical protein
MKDTTIRSGPYPATDSHHEGWDSAPMAGGKPAPVMQREPGGLPPEEKDLIEAAFKAGLLGGRPSAER